MSQSKRIKVENCIIHKSNNTSDKLVSLRNIRGDPHEKLQFLQEIRRKRMSQPFGFAARMEKICERYPSKYLPLDSKSRQLFPPECIFCDKLQKRRNDKVENCQNFPVF